MKIDQPFKRFHNIHKGKRCFVLGNGASLNSVDLTKLKNEITFGCNKIWLNYPKMKYAVMYYFLMDSQEIKKGILGIKQYLIYGEKEIKCLFMTNTATIADRTKERLKKMVTVKMMPVSHFVRQYGIKHSCTSPLMIVMAMIMGCNPIYLLGVDLNYDDYEIYEPVNEELNQYRLKPNAEDRVHFHPDYLRGDVFSYPNNSMMRLSHWQLAQFAKRERVKIYVASASGKADMFEQVDFKWVMSEKVKCEKCGMKYPYNKDGRYPFSFGTGMCNNCYVEMMS